MSWLWLVAALVPLAWAVWVFNRLIRLRNRAAGAWSDIDVQLKRRHDVVANLVETVKGYARHERQTLEEVVRARDTAERARQGGRPAEAAGAETRLSGRLDRLLAVVEAYPELRASHGFVELQQALTTIENDLQHARRYYNAVVRDLNTRIQSFPDVLLARPLGFAEREFFRLEHAGEAAVPRVDLGAGR